MPHEKIPPGSASDWLIHAKSDLSIAKTRNDPDILTESLCFHAQQCAEKSIKAVFVYINQDFPKTHNLKTLMDILKTKKSIPEKIMDGASLTHYAVSTRYPGDYETISEDEYFHAINQAELIYNWALNICSHKF